MKTIARFVVLVGTAALSACSAYDPYYHTKIGATSGAIAGGVLGHQFDHDEGRFYGAAAGALLGGAVGNSMDAQRYDYQRALEAERRRTAELQRYQQQRYPYGYGY